MPNSALSALSQLLLAEVHRRIFEESYARVQKCLSLLSEQEVWQRPNRELVSIGNLILHLCGNLRQWVVSGLGKQPDIRERAREFSERGPIPTDLLLQKMEAVKKEVEQVLNQIGDRELMASYTVQGFTETGVSILMHVTEHFSYHTGQISWYTKLLTEADLGYYAGQELNNPY